MRLTIEVPATSANLGAGYDCFGIALDLCNTVTFETGVQPQVTWEGEGADELPTDGTDMISCAVEFVMGEETPPLAIHGINRIPLERGLGSSSAAAVAGILAGNLLKGAAEGIEHQHPEPGRIFKMAAEFEGHPDNAAPAVYGGFTIAGGSDWVLRLDTDDRLRPVVLIPKNVRLATSEARAAVPSEVSIGDAIANISRAALGVVAFTQDPSLIGEALLDRLHQPYRLPLIPEVAKVFENLASAGIPVCVSGAGPTLLAFDTPAGDVPDPGEGWTVLRPSLRPHGAEIIEG